jgi:hypothetical protein
MVADFFDFSLERKKIFERIGLLIGVSEKCGGVEGAHKEDSALFNEIAVLFCNFEIL